MAQGLDLDGTLIGDVTNSCVGIETDDPLDSAGPMLVEAMGRPLPVLEGDSVAGMISGLDLAAFQRAEMVLGARAAEIDMSATHPDDESYTGWAPISSRASPRFSASGKPAEPRTSAGPPGFSTCRADTGVSCES